MQWMLSVQILLLLLLPHGCKWMNVSSGTGSPRQRQLNSCACVRACVRVRVCTAKLVNYLQNVLELKDAIQLRHMHCHCLTPDPITHPLPPALPSKLPLRTIKSNAWWSLHSWYSKVRLEPRISLTSVITHHSK